MGEASTKLRALAIMLAGVLAAGSAHAQNQPDRTIEQFKCKDVMREPDQNRAVAIAFLHGYLLGKSGDSKFNVDVLEKQTDAHASANQGSRPVAAAIVGPTDRASPAAAGYCAFADGLALRRPKTAKTRCEQH